MRFLGLAAATLLANYPESSLRDQSTASLTRPVMRTSWAKSFSSYPARRGHAQRTVTACARDDLLDHSRGLRLVK